MRKAGIRSLIVAALAGFVFFASDRGLSSGEADKEKLKLELGSYKRQAEILREGVKKLGRHLRHPDEEIRFLAASTLRECRHDSVWALDDLREALYDESARVRQQAARAMQQMGPLAKRAVPDLIRVLKDSDIQVRRCVVSALSASSGDAKIVVPALIQALDDPDPGMPGTPGDPSVRRAAIHTLGVRYGPEAKEAVPALRTRLQASKDIDECGLIILALGRIKADLDKMIPELVGILNDPKQEAYHGWAVSALGAIGAPAKTAIPTLIRIFPCRNLKEPDRVEGRQKSIMYALKDMGTEAASAVPFVVECCKNPNLRIGVRHNAFQVLGHIGKGSKEAVDCLVACVTIEDCRTFSPDISVGLELLGKDAVKPLIEALSRADDSREARKSEFIYLIGRMGVVAAEAVPLLESLKEDPKYKFAASRAIKTIKSKTVK